MLQEFVRGHRTFAFCRGTCAGHPPVASQEAPAVASHCRIGAAPWALHASPKSQFPGNLRYRGRRRNVKIARRVGRRLHQVGDHWRSPP